MTEFVMPTLGADMSAGTLVGWRKQPGDSVARGEIIAEVHTDKADVEVESFTSGVIERFLAEPGQKVPVGTPLAIIREEGAAAAGRILASPSAKALAADLGVDLGGVRGSGPGGRIQRRDVQKAEAPAPTEGEDRQAAMRRAIAAAMARSKREIPHFYLGETVDMSRAVAWLAAENAHRPVQDRLLHGVLLLKAVAAALREAPELNATWQGDRVVRSEAVHLGIAIFVRGGGLVAPAVHDADRKSLDELMSAFRDLVSRARAGTLRSSELSDPTITVTSLGERGTESVLPIIFPPQVAIVGFGRLVERPWIFEGQMLPCPLVTATLAADHRVTDGHRAAGFLAAVDRLLQAPEEL